MKFFVIDDEKFALDRMVRELKTAAPEAEVTAFSEPGVLLEYAKSNVCDVAFLDVRMGSMTGVELAKKLKEFMPKLNIIFVTGYDEYAGEAMKMHASGYLMKPVTSEDIKAELQDLRYPIFEKKNYLLYFRCFGVFEVFNQNGELVCFERKKAKELLAYLLYRQGKKCTNQELHEILFEDGIKIVQGETALEIENVSARGVNELASGVVAEIKKIGVAIFLSKNSDGSLSLTTSSTDNEKKFYTVETRISALENESEMPYYFKTELSTLPSSVEFVDGQGNMLENGKTVKVNEAFTVRNNFGKEIQSVQVAYSQTGNYTAYETVYDGEYHKIVFEKEGTYHVKVLNKYGIQTDYYVVISSQFVMSATVEYIDGTTIEYSIDYVKENDEIYSNKSVEFVVYATNIKVLETDEAISIMPSEQQGYTSIYVNSQGNYYLKIADEYGNILEKHIYIQAKSLELNEKVLTNFNEKALRRDENYTNQQIFLDKNAVEQSGIAFIFQFAYSFQLHIQVFQKRARFQPLERGIHLDC